MKTREPWWRTLAKLLILGALGYLVGAAVLLWAAVVTGSWLYWLLGSLMLFGAIMVARWAWDIRR